MTGLQSELLRTLEMRGFVHQCTDLAALDALATEQVVTAYVGYGTTYRRRSRVSSCWSMTCRRRPARALTIFCIG
jgi:hypothetical protein